MASPGGQAGITSRCFPDSVVSPTAWLARCGATHSAANAASSASINVARSSRAATSGALRYSIEISASDHIVLDQRCIAQVALVTERRKVDRPVPSARDELGKTAADCR